MFCIHCGKPVQEGQKFCAHCGKPIPPSEPVQPPKAPVSQEQATAPSKKKNKAIIGVAAAALVIVIGFFIGSGLGGDKDGSPAISHASQSGGVGTKGFCTNTLSTWIPPFAVWAFRFSITSRLL